MRTRLLIHAVLISSLLLATGCETGIYHTVQPGQTLYRISRTYGVNEGYLARVNGISNPSQLGIGTRLYVPGAERVLPVPVVRVEETGKPDYLPQADKPVSVAVKKEPVTKVAADPITAPLSTKPSVAGIKKLQWPLRGKIVRSFSETARAGGGKGIEIAVRAGSDVAAAEAGKVIYSGDGVNGYGYLIILQHENDLFTVYGFNQSNLVKQGEFVSKGEKIAVSGVPPSGGKARLHFEVRKGKQAVNPILYLP